MPGRYGKNKMNNNIVILDEEEFEREYHKAFEPIEFSDDLTEEQLAAEFEDLDKKLRDALSAHWEEDFCGEADFAISGCFQGTWHHCGGIYSGKICCPEYVKIISQTLLEQPHGDLWTYHTVCEVFDDDDDDAPFGEFFIRNGVLYAPDDENEYKKYFE